MPTPRTARFVLTVGLCLSITACRGGAGAHPTGAASISAPAEPAAPVAPTAPATPAAVAVPSNPHLVAHWGGTAHGLVVDGNRAYFGHGMRLAVADVSRPKAPRALAESAAMGGTVRDIVQAKGVIVALVGDAVQVVDIARPLRPVLRGRFAVSGTVAAVTAKGSTAYVLTKGGPVHVVDLVDADAPTEIARVDGLAGARDLALSGTTLYVSGDALAAVDVRDPQRPVVLGRAPIQGARIFVAGKRAYVEDTSRTNHFSWLQVVDVRDPTNMRVVHEHRSRFVTDIAFSGRRQFKVGRVSDGGRGPCCTLEVLEVKPSGELADFGSIELSASGLGDLVLAGSWLYVLGWDGGLRVVNVARPSAPVEVGTLPIVAEAHGAAVVGRSAFAITGQMNGGGAYRHNRFLDAFDLSEPAEPRHVGRLELGGVGHRVAVADGRAVVKGDSGVTILDVSDPAHMRRLGGWTSERVLGGVREDRSWWSEMAFSGDDLWLTDATHIGADMGSLVHLDVTDPSTPRLVERILLDTEPVAIARAGDHLYVAGSQDRYGRVANALSGIRILAPASGNDGSGGAHQVGYVELPGGVSDVAVSGDRLYVLDDRLRIFDLRTPTKPTPRGTLALGTDAFYERLAADGTTVYLGRSRGGAKVLVVDVSDPDAPRVVDEVAGLPGRVVGMTVAQEGIVAALGEGGLGLVRGR